MPMPTKKHTVETQIRDIGLAAAATVKGWTAKLVDTGNGIILFSFEVEPHDFSRLESDYWAGKLTLSARDVIVAQRMLKDRLYALKRPMGRKP